MEKKILFSIEGQGGDELIKKIADIQSSTRKLQDDNKALNKTIKDGKDANGEAAQAFAKNKIEIQQNGKEVRDLTSQYNANIKATQDHNNSIKNLGIQLGALRTQYDHLSDEQRENTKEGQALLANIQKLDGEYKDLTATTGRFQSSVGDYTNAIDKSNVGNVNMRKELSNLKKEMAQLIVEGKRGSDEFNTMRDRAGQLQDAMGKASMETRKFADDHRVLRDVVNSLNFVAQGAQLVTSATALMGFESEKFEKTIQKVVAISGVANSINNMSNIILKNTHLVTMLVTKGKLAWIAVQKMLNVALTTTKGLLMSLGIGIIIAALGMLVAKWDQVSASLKKAIDFLMFWKKGSEDMIEAQESQLDVINRLLDAQNKQIDNLTKEIELMKAKGRSIDDIKRKERELILEQLESAKTRMQIAFMESASLDATTEQREEAAKKFREEYKMIDDIYHRLEVFDAAEVKRQEDQTNKLIEESNKRSEVRKKEKDEEEKLIDDINNRNAIAEAELAVILNDNLENRLNREQVYYDQKIKAKEYTDRELELLEAQHLLRLDAIRDEWIEANEEKKIEDEVIVDEKKIAEREKYLAELEQRRLDELDYFERRQELLDYWLKMGVISEAEYTKELGIANKRRLDNERRHAIERMNINMQYTSMLISNIAKMTEGSAKFFEFNKRISQLEAVINTYLGVSQVLRDSTLPTYAKIIAVASVMSTGLAAVLKIRNQQAPQAPQYAEGGIIDGKSHSQGGEQLYLGNNHIGEVEGGEYLAIINKNDAQRASLLDSINRKHGKALFNSNRRFFKEGGVFDPRMEFNTDLTDQLRDIVREIAYIPVVLSVRDINDGQEELRVIETRGDLK